MLNFLLINYLIIISKKITTIMINSKHKAFHTAKNGDMIIYLIKKIKPESTINMSMSNIYEVETVKKIKKNDKKAIIKVMSVNEKEDIFISLKEDVLRYILKLFVVDKVQKKISNVFSECYVKENKDNLDDKYNGSNE